MQPKVLVVEDELCIRTILARELRRRFAVIEAASVAEALAALARPEPICAVLADEHLEDGSGLALLAAIEERAPWCARVLMSAVLPEGLPPNLVVLEKPWRFGAVHAALERALAMPIILPVDGAMDGTIEIDAEMFTDASPEGVPVTIRG